MMYVRSLLKCETGKAGRALTFRQGLDGIHDGLWDAHLLDADVCRVEEHLRDSKALIGQPQDLLSRLVLPAEDHLLQWLVGREEERFAKYAIRRRTLAL